MGNALALLFPIDWPEPFGLVMIEAMSCGTPVIAYDNGSVPEVIDDGVTGFIVNSQEEAGAAVRKIDTISRAGCRERFEKRFSSRVMAENYLNLYQSTYRDGRESEIPEGYWLKRIWLMNDYLEHNDLENVDPVSFSDERNIVLKQGDTFAIFDIYGDVNSSADS